MGGSIHSRSSIELPCNMKHSNLQPTRSNSPKLLSGVSDVKDCFIAVTEKCKAPSKDRLVCAIVAAPEPWPLQIGYRLAAYRPGLILLYPVQTLLFWGVTLHLTCMTSVSLVLYIHTVACATNRQTMPVPWSDVHSPKKAV